MNPGQLSHGQVLGGKRAQLFLDSGAQLGSLSTLAPAVACVLSRVPCVLGGRAGFSLGSKFCRERHFFEWERHPG